MSRDIRGRKARSNTTHVRDITSTRRYREAGTGCSGGQTNAPANQGVGGRTPEGRRKTKIGL